MGSTRVRLSYAFVAALLGCGLLAGVPISALAAPVNQGAASVAAHPHGFYVSGLGRAVAGDNSTALVRDGAGRQHIVTSVRSTSATGNRGHIVYLTRRPGAKHWLSREIPGLRPMDGGIRVEIHLSFADTRVFVVLYQCNGVFVTDASLTSTRLPEPQLVQAAGSCGAPGSPAKASAPPIVNAIALPGDLADTIGILLPDPAQGGQEAIFEGVPGDPFTAEKAYGTTDSVVPKQMTIDDSTGQITVIGAGTDGTYKGIYDWTKPWWSNWPAAPVRIASLASPSVDYTVESVTAFRGSVWVGLLKPRSATHAGHTLYTVHGNDAGQWFGAVPLPHSTNNDTALQLAINENTNHLHAAFTRVDPAAPVKKSGIMSEAFFKGKWQSLKFFTHWDRDYTTQITLTQSGHAVLGYIQR